MRKLNKLWLSLFLILGFSVQLTAQAPMPKISDGTNTYWYYMKNHGQSSEGNANNRAGRVLAKNVDGYYYGLLPWNNKSDWAKFKVVAGSVEGKYDIITEDGLFLTAGVDGNLTDKNVFATEDNTDWTFNEATDARGIKAFRLKNNSGTRLQLKIATANFAIRSDYTSDEDNNLWNFMPVDEPIVKVSDATTTTWYRVKNLDRWSNSDLRADAYMIVAPNNKLSVSRTAPIGWKFVAAPTAGKYYIINEDDKYISRTPVADGHYGVVNADAKDDNCMFELYPTFGVKSNTTDVVFANNFESNPIGFVLHPHEYTPNPFTTWTSRDDASQWRLISVTDEMNKVYAEATALLANTVAGKSPGQYPVALREALQAAVNTANGKIATGSPTSDDLLALETAYQNYSTAMIVPIVSTNDNEKWYYIQAERPDNTYMTASGGFVPDNAIIPDNTQLWKLVENTTTANSSTGFALVNKATGEYIGTDVNNNNKFPTQAGMPNNKLKFRVSTTKTNGTYRFFIENATNSTPALRFHAGGSYHNWSAMNYTGNETDHCTWLFWSYEDAQRKFLQDALALVTKLINAPTGTEFGKYNADKAPLISAKNQAQDVYDNSDATGQQLENAVAALNTQINTFKAAFVQDKTVLTGTDATKYKWYTITSAATAHPTILGQVVSSNGKNLEDPFRIEDKPTNVPDAQLFRFELDSEKLKIINKANGKYMDNFAKISNTAGLFSLVLLEDQFAFNINNSTGNEHKALHVGQANGDLTIWNNDAGTGSAWVFDYVKTTTTTISWRGESNNSNWLNEGGADGDKHWYNASNGHTLTRPDIVTFGSTDYVGNDILFDNNTYAGNMNVNGAAFKVNSITFTSNASNQRTLNSGDGGSINFDGVPSLIVNNSGITHTFNLPIEISGTNLTVYAVNNPIAIHGIISGSGGLTKGGEHNLYLSGNNTYAGVTTVSEGKLVVEGNMTMASLDIASGATLEVAAGKQLTITGAATNAGTIILKTGATIVGDIAGTATVEQAAEEKRTYYIGSPVSGTGVGSANIGDYITFTESTDTWSAAAAFSGLAPDFGKGYGVQVAAGGTHGTPATISFTGTLNNSPAAQTVGMTIGKNQFNFLGNPYPSYLSSATVLAGGDVEQSLWFYTRTATTPEVKYQFITYNPASGGTVIPETEGIDGNVAPMQGFWVKANTASNFTFSNAMRSHKVGSAAFRAPQASEKQVLRLQVSNGMVSDEAVILFSENANSDWNSSKMMNEGLNIYTVKAGADLALNSRTAIEYDVETAVGVKAESGAYTFSVSKFENFGTDKAFLLDKATGVSTDLSTGDYTVNFTEAYQGTDRFALVFPRSGVISGLEDAESTGFFAFANNNRISVNSDAQAGMIYVFNAVGQQVAAEAISGTLTTVSTALPAGVYMVKVNNLTTKVVVR